MLTFRTVTPCERCVSMTICPVILNDGQRFCESENRLAEIAGKPMPDAELVFHCSTFSPRGRLRPAKTKV